MRSEAAPVAVVGGGFSGVMTAVQLAGRGIASRLFDGAGRMGQGVAYSTCQGAHLLNVPAAKMSAWTDQPGDFAEWLGSDGTTFAERRQFGAYLQEILRRTNRVEPIEGTVTAAERTGDGWNVGLEDGRAFLASAVVLANGNQAPPTMHMAEQLPKELFVNNPWGAEANAAVTRVAETHDDVLLLGTGLTMVDTVLSLDAAGHQGRITALSRRGLMPRVHAPHDPAPVAQEEVPHGDLLELWGWLRRRSERVGFRAAVDGLRPYSQSLWQAFSPKDQQRFLRHARPWWDVHRHRIAPEVGSRLAELVAEGRLQVVAGRIREVRQEIDRLVVHIATRRGAAEERRFAVAFNCTGPLGEMARTQDPLLQQLLREQRICIDPLGIGLAVSGEGRAGDSLWAVGPLTKGTYWEIVAVPDIRGQAAAIAEDIAKELAE